MSDVTTSLNGTIEDVASFFNVSIRTIQEWKAEKPPRIAYWQDGRNVVFGEEAVIEYKAAGYVASRRMDPGEAKEIARREWRAHLKLRDLESTQARMDLLEQRLEALEKELKAA